MYMYIDCEILNLKIDIRLCIVTEVTIMTHKDFCFYIVQDSFHTVHFKQYIDYSLIVCMIKIRTRTDTRIWNNIFEACDKLR